MREGSFYKLIYDILFVSIRNSLAPFKQNPKLVDLSYTCIEKDIGSRCTMTSSNGSVLVSSISYGKLSDEFLLKILVTWGMSL